MSDESGRWSITFNGEIFNFRELRPVLERRGHVLLLADGYRGLLKRFIEFGPACLPMLSGMFAFAIWDRPRELFIARDRIGKKPLFYYASRELFVLASEPKSLFRTRTCPAGCATRRSPNTCVSGTRAAHTLDQGISNIPPSHWGVLEDGRLRLERYWSPPPILGEPSPMVHGTADEVRNRLRDAVRSRMIADVPVGVYLSGGLDSSMVTALMARESAGEVRSYSVGSTTRG